MRQRAQLVLKLPGRQCASRLGARRKKFLLFTVGKLSGQSLVQLQSTCIYFHHVILLSMPAA
jgi:hypothetical protein